MFRVNLSLAKHVMPCRSKQCRSDQMASEEANIWICTVCHQICKFLSKKIGSSNLIGLKLEVGVAS